MAGMAGIDNSLNVPTRNTQTDWLKPITNEYTTTQNTESETNKNMLKKIFCIKTDNAIPRLKTFSNDYIPSHNNQIDTNKNLLRDKIRTYTEKAIPSTRMCGPSIKDLVTGTVFRTVPPFDTYTVEVLVKLVYTNKQSLLYTY